VKYLAEIGLGLIVIALACALTLPWKIAGILYAIIFIGDITLSITFRETISQTYHYYFPQWIDTGIMMLLLIGIFLVFGGQIGIYVLSGVVIGHLCWHDD